MNLKIEFIHFKPRELSETRVLSLLSDIDDQYIPPISSLTQLLTYAQKLVLFADIIMAVRGGTDAGLCAIYTNRPPIAFISSLGLIQSLQRAGYGGYLLQQAIRVAKEQGCAKVVLEVHRQNKRALLFYKNAGFYYCGTKDDFYCMLLNM